MEKLGLSFSLLIAYFIPGLAGLYVISPFSQTIENLLKSNNGVPNAASLIPIVVMGLGFGMIINVLSAISIRKVFKFLGVKSIKEDEFSNLKSEDLPVCEKLVENHYRYFECYSNLSMVLFLYIACKLFLKFQEIFTPCKKYLFILCLIVVLFALLRASYQCYRTYVVRMRKLLS